MFVTDARCYLSERILNVRIGLLWLWLLACTLFSVTEPLSALPWLLPISALFVLAFRLWDDLADIEYDRRHHPTRCLVRTANIQPFLASLWTQLAILTGLLFFLKGEVHALSLLILIVVFFVMYRLTARHPEQRPVRVTLVLAKYPAFVLLLSDAPGRSSALLFAMAAYLPPLVDEIRSSGPRLLIPVAAFLSLSMLSWMTLTK